MCRTSSGDPGLLGLGELEVKDVERMQPRAGRLDLLLQDPDSYRRYTVELQLGATDESHIIRALEYWDIERKRYPQYDYCAVLVAEDITSRFLNVIALSLMEACPSLLSRCPRFKLATLLLCLLRRSLTNLLAV